MSAIQAIAGQGAGQIQADYLKLLTTQLMNQNPLEPLSNNEMASQMAQLSQLQQVEQMGRTFKEVLVSQQLTQAVSLVGRQVSFVPPDSNDPVTGRVDSVELVEGQVQLHVGTYTVGLDDLRTIQ